MFLQVNRFKHTQNLLLAEITNTLVFEKDQKSNKTLITIALANKNSIKQFITEFISQKKLSDQLKKVTVESVSFEPAQRRCRSVSNKSSESSSGTLSLDQFEDKNIRKLCKITTQTTILAKKTSDEIAQTCNMLKPVNKRLRQISDQVKVRTENTLRNNN